MIFCYTIIVYVIQITSNEVYKSDSDITDVPGTISHIPQLISSDLEETQTISSPEEEVTLSICEHIGSNTILLNVRVVISNKLNIGLSPYIR